MEELRRASPRGATGTLLVVGLGIQWGGQTTHEARRAIEAADRVLFAVADPFAARFARSLHPRAEALPYAAPGEPRLQAYEQIVEHILQALREGGKVCAVFYGDPSFLAYPAHQALRRARADGFQAQMLPGVSALSCLCADLGVDPGEDGCQVYEATRFLRRRPRFDTRAQLVLCQVGWIGQHVGFEPLATERVREGLVRLSAALAQHYPGDHPAIIYEAASHPLSPPRIVTTTVAALAEVAVSDCATLFLPPVATSCDAAARPGIASLDPEDHS